MLLKNSVFAVAFLAVGLLGYQLGAGQSHPPVLPTVTLEDVQVSQIHPAALYVRTAAGKEQRYFICDLDPNWASSLRQHQQSHWYLELTASPWCPGRYRVQTAVEQPE